MRNSKLIYYTLKMETNIINYLAGELNFLCMQECYLIFFSSNTYVIADARYLIRVIRYILEEILHISVVSNIDIIFENKISEKSHLL